MSISALSSSGMSGIAQEMQQAMRGSRGTPPDPDQFGSDVISRDDADGDGFISLAETGLGEEEFNSVDADGDGLLSEDELNSDFQQKLDQQNALMGELTVRMQGISGQEDAESIFAQDDADGNGFLTLDETPLDEDMFNSIDADGDGQISTEELSTHMEEHMGEARDSLQASTSDNAESASAAAAGAPTTTTQEEEEYDEYDLNQDGEVSFDELQQAFFNGDTGLSNLFGLGNSQSSSVSPMTQRLAMEAYSAQSL